MTRSCIENVKGAWKNLMLLDQHKKNRISWRNELSSSKRFYCQSQQTRQQKNRANHQEEEDTPQTQKGLAAFTTADDTLKSNGNSTSREHQDRSDSMKNKNRRQVHFGVVLVREHSLTIGDHPMCNDPLPLTLDWVHTDEQRYDINIYESTRTLRYSIRQGREGGGSKNQKNLSSNNTMYDRVTRLCYWKRRDLLKDQLRLSNKEMVDLELSLAQKLS